MSFRNRRQFVRDLGLSSAALPLVLNLPSFARSDSPTSASRKQRLVIVFSPNGVVPTQFWPDQEGREFELKEILSPLKAYQDRMLILKGVSNKVRGDGDSHMRGMSCLLTGIELFPGNIQGGSHTPAGWASGLSIDQEMKNFLQGREETQTRFGSLEFGVSVSNRADPWTRMIYSGPNKPVASIDDPYEMFKKLYGQVQDRESLESILEPLKNDLATIRKHLSAEDKKKLEEHEAFVRQMELDLQKERGGRLAVDAPQLKPGVKNNNSNMPKLCQMQLDLLVNALANDMTRVASFQITKSVGQARMTWLDIDDSHHSLSHKPDTEEESQAKLVKINRWYCEQIAHLVKKLDETPEPDGSGSLLDNTTVVWTNELGKGNSHTLNDIPFVLVGNGMGFEMGRSLKYDRVEHNRLLMSLAHAMGHGVESFGNPKFCDDGALTGLV